MSGLKRSVSLYAVAAVALSSTVASWAAAPALAEDVPLAGELPSCSAGSTGIVLSILPASHGALLERDGQLGRLHDLATLCPGDNLVLGSGETAVLELQGGRGSDEPLEGPTEFTVPNAEGMLDNAAQAMARVLFPEVSNRTRTLVTRSDGATMSPRPENMGMRLPQELAYVDAPRSVWFGWTGGAAPFHVTLEDTSGAVLAEAEVSSSHADAIRIRHTRADGVVAEVPYDVTFSDVSLEPGEYRFRVSDAGSEPPEVAALMSDDDAGVMSMPFLVSAELTGVPARSNSESISVSDVRAAVEALCFSMEQPENRLFEAAQHIVNGRNGEVYATALSLLGSDINDEERAALCGE